MKALALLIALFYAEESLAVAPYGFKGQNQTATQYSNVLQFPNNQITNIGGINSLAETGNTNLLVNPGFEHGTFSTGWTTTGTTATLSAETTAIIHGKKALKTVASAQNISVVQDSTLYAAQFKGTVQGFVGAWISNTAPSVLLCARAAGVTLTGNNCVTLATDGLWKRYQIPVVLSATSNGIAINGISVTGTMIADEGFVGVLANSFPEVAQAQLAGEAYFAGTSSCTWSRTSTTIGALASTAACPGPTIVEQNVGSWQTTDSDLPRVTVNNLPAGKYKATFLINSGIGTSAQLASAAIFDGTTTCQSSPATSSTQNGAAAVTCTFSYTTSGNRAFELYVASAANAFNINNNNTAPPTQTKFFLEYYPPPSAIYSQPNNVDTDWVSCGLTTSDFAGFGTVSSIEDRCKKDGADLLIRVKFTPGTTTATEARMNLRLQGTALTSAGASIIPSLSMAGNYAVAASSASYFIALIEPSVGYMTFGHQNATLAGLQKRNGNDVVSSGNAVSIKARIPIVGWTQSQITGTFAEVATAPGISKPKTCYYAFGGASATLAAPTECTTGTCVEVYDSCGTAIPPTVSGTADYINLTYASGTWANSTFLKCDCEAFDVTTATVRECDRQFITGNQSWSTNSSGGANLNLLSKLAGTPSTSYISLECTGQAP